MECQAPLHERKDKAPHTNVNPPYGRLPGDGSACVSAKEHSAMNPISTYNVGEKLRK